jgi:transcriptional regulator with XRE-family HTH domain
MADLFVRIPDELKTRLARSAYTRGTSLAEEVTRLLSEQLADDRTASMKSAQLNVQLQLHRTGEKLFEKMILSLDGTRGADALAAQVAQAQAALLERIERQELTRREIEVTLQERREEAARAQTEVPRRARPFDGLLHDEGAAMPVNEVPRPERRLWALRAVLSRQPRGTKKRLADALNWTPAQISQLLSNSHAPGHRRISDETARKLETALGIEPSTLDELDKSQSATLIQALTSLLKTFDGLHRVTRDAPRPTSSG